MAERVYRAAIIGVGFIGGADQVSGDALGQKVTDLDGTHADALAKHPRVELVAGSSRDAGRRERFARRTGARAFADWHEMLDREQPDIVSIATYAPQHAPITAACAARKIQAIYCEKPIATTIADAEQMVSSCREAGSLLVINHNRRFNPNYRRLRDVLAEGGLGKVTSANLQWGRGRLGNVGSHLFDAVQMITGRVIEAVSGTLDLSRRPDCRGPLFEDPGGWGLLRLQGGLVVTVDAADHAEGPARIVINAIEGRAVTGGDDVTLEFRDGRRDHWPSQRGEATSMDRAVHEIVEHLDRRQAGTPDHGLADHIDEVRTLEAIAAFHVSHARQSAWVELPLTGADRNTEVRSG